MHQSVNLLGKIAIENNGCVFACFCGGYKNKFSIINNVTRSLNIAFAWSKYYFDFETYKI